MSTPPSVRLALPHEGSAIASVQRRAWEQTLPAGVSGALLAEVDLETMGASWEASIGRPPLARLRVLVATEEGAVAGFAAIGPSDDPDANPAEDALVGAFAVDPKAQRRGHGSRLLAAIADTLRADGFTRATWWVPSTDDALRRFLVGTGWDADGAHREVASSADADRLRLVRLHTALA